MLKKSAVIAVVCFVVLCVSGYSEPTPEQVKERTQLLCEAINSDNVEQAKVCIKLGADVNAKVYCVCDSDRKYYITTYKQYYDYTVYTPLLYVVEYNKGRDLVELLIKSGAGLNAKNKFDRTALMECALRGYIDVAEILIKAGADVNSKVKSGSTALHMASDILSYEKKVEVCKNMVELLVKAGADVNAKGGYGATAILPAARIGVKDVVELLIKAGADVNTKTNNDDGWTALMCAAYEGHKDVVEVLIKAGADMNVENKYGDTALIKAARKGHKDVAELLIKAGADGGQALVWTIKAKHSDAAKMLINAGVNPNAKDSEGISVLTYAMLYGQNDIADLLRAAGAKE